MKEKKKIDPEFVLDGAESIDKDDIERANKNAEKIEGKIKGSSKLRSFLADFKILSALLKDYWKGNYRNIPYKSIGVVVFTLLYVLNVADVVPDFIPGLGLLDDATVIGLCLKIVNAELQKYSTWKAIKQNEPLTGPE
jgi:uncharacterized membrane protein YkvA (DUF1232 family)